MTEEVTAPTWTLDQWADFWRYSIGVNVLPAISKDKKPSVNWIGWQNKPILKIFTTDGRNKVHFQQGLR
jgi:hypothetical protein